MKNHLTKAVLAAAAVTCMASAHAQRREVVREHERPRYATPHLVFDDRFHHNHYYPALGYQVDVLPPGNIAIGFRGAQFWFHSGVFYQHVGPRYVVVRPPVGVIIPVLPAGYTTVYYGSVPYYYADDTYYVQQPGGYEVVAQPEAAASVPQPGPGPGAGAPVTQAAGTWYYCDSAKAYYPYVQQCPEGWRSVPASPPPAR